MDRVTERERVCEWCECMCRITSARVARRLAKIMTDGAYVQARCIHLALAVAFEETRMKRARRVDGVLPRESSVRGTHGALSEPWQRYLPTTLMWFKSRWRRGGAHRAGTARALVPGARANGGGSRRSRLRTVARRYRHCRRAPPAPATAIARSHTLAHYAASVSSYISRIYSTKGPSAEPREGRA